MAVRHLFGLAGGLGRVANIVALLDGRGGPPGYPARLGGESEAGVGLRDASATTVGGNTTRPGLAQLVAESLEFEQILPPFVFAIALRRKCMGHVGDSSAQQYLPVLLDGPI